VGYCGEGVRVPFPDFIIIGAPKAGSTALHAALVQHPDLFLSRPKEPKYFLTDGFPPRGHGQRGPGDAHSAQEWLWRTSDYERLFEPAPPGRLRGESTPFYLWSRDAHRKMARIIPQVKMVAVIRDPVERAYSNWTHLWADGLEPESDFLTACRLEPERVAAGWAPFWRYVELGRYGEQLEHLYQHFPREQVLVLRYRDMVDDPARALDTVCTFLGIRTGIVQGIPPSNVGRWADDSPRNRRLRRAIRFGAGLGRFAHPAVWRRIERRMLGVLQKDSGPRPRIDPAARRELLELYRDDVALLERLTGDSFRDWFGDGGTDLYRAARPAS
jgi:hypothetical protein